MRALCEPLLDPVFHTTLLYKRYTLLVGRPPFETSNWKETYAKIMKNDYKIPGRVQLSHGAQDLIHKMLHPKPRCRPTLQQVKDHEFFKGFTPASMPKSALTLVRGSRSTLPPFCGVGVVLECVRMAWGKTWWVMSSLPNMLL